MKEILVLQNQRIGDTLQTTPLLAGLREKHHPCRITLVTNKLFAGLRMDDLVDEVVHFDQNRCFETLSDSRTSLAAKYDALRRFLEPLWSRRFDLVIDVPADTHMHLLASAVARGGQVRGAVLSAARTFSCTHPEVMLLYTIGLCREINRFNLVDLQNLMAGVRPADRKLHLAVGRAAEQAADGLLAQGGADPGSDFLVALQPGASEERKRWGEGRFAQLARLLVEKCGARVILCGSSDEAPLGASIEREAGVPLISAVGRTAIDELGALLRRCRVLVTNDTGTMHVSAAVGTPVIDISTGPVFFRETGPYLEGSLVIEGDIECSPCNFNAVCHHYSCREQILPGMVLQLVELAAGRRPAHSLKPADFGGARVHRARFNDVGRLEFLPLFPRRLTCSELLGFFYAHAWEVFYGLRAGALPTRELLATIGRHHDLEGSWGAIRDEVRNALEELRHLENQIGQGTAILRSMRGRSARRQGEWVVKIEQLQDVYRRILFYGKTRPCIRHFTALLELAVEAEAGAEPAAAVARMDEAFHRVSGQVSFLRTRLKRAVQRLDDRVLHSALNGLSSPDTSPQTGSTSLC